MNNEENKPSKDMMDMIKEHTDKCCDMVIDKCIGIVRGELAEAERHSQAESLLKIIIIKFHNLKSTTNEQYII